MESTARWIVTILLATVGVAFGACYHFTDEEMDRLYNEQAHTNFHKKGTGGYILSKLDKNVEDLNLTAAQEEKYATIRKKIERDLDQGRDKRNQFLADLDESQKAKVVSEMCRKLERFPEGCH